MLTLNDRINNRHKIVQNLDGTVAGFSNYIKNRGLYFHYEYGEYGYYYYYVNGYIAFINALGHIGLTVNFSGHQGAKDAFNRIKHLHNPKKYV